MWDGLEGERDDHAGRRREARVPAAGAVREVVDGRESRHVFIVRRHVVKTAVPEEVIATFSPRVTARQAESRRKRIVKAAPSILWR